MTPEDYELIARTIKTAPRFRDLERRRVAKHFASALAKDNPYFDVAKFREACQSPPEYSLPRFEVVHSEGGWRVRDDETGLISPVPFSEKVARRKAEESNRELEEDYI